MTEPSQFAIDWSDITAAAERISSLIENTPVMRSDAIDALVGCRVVFKCEHLQRTGSFKFRGACNAIASLSSIQLQSGVVTWSSGNHAQAIATAAMMLGTSAVIVMPTDAPKIKLAATKSAGARVILYDRYADDREAIGAKIAATESRVIVPPYDHRHVIAGQGTVGAELFRTNSNLDFCYVCVGGGGLLAGTSTAAAALSPGTKMVGVEPEAGDDHRRSREAGFRVRVPVPKTIADGQQTVMPGELTWPINDARVYEFKSVSDAEIVTALRVLHRELGLTVEPSGASAFASVIADPPPRGSSVGVTLSGGNVDPGWFTTHVANH